MVILKKFNFTIREILFLVVAVCALLALYQAYRTSPPTGVPNAINARRLVDKRISELNLPITVHGSSSGTNGSTRRIRKTSDVKVQVGSKETVYDLMKELNIEVHSILQDEGCSIVFSGSRNSGYGDLESFSYDYSSGKTKGAVLVRLIPSDPPMVQSTPKQNWEIWVLALEYCR